jgi:16S rRNA (uracil1498-N3)-methyltransferase
MSLRCFYIEQYDSSASFITLNEETSKHAVQVLRMQPGEQINLTDGMGHSLTAIITEAHKKQCVVKVIASQFKPGAARKLAIAISLVKNASRFEWFLEKATEIGVNEIIPLICERTEKQHFRYDRMKGILVSAMLQSKQSWLPVLHAPVKFEDFIIRTRAADGLLKLIAHCEETSKQSIHEFQLQQFSTIQICIGPEGDFSPREIALALKKNFQPVMLGETRLRTETAGVVAATLLKMFKYQALC